LNKTGEGVGYARGLAGSARLERPIIRRLSSPKVEEEEVLSIPVWLARAVFSAVRQRLSLQPTFLRRSSFSESPS